jgi:hypothetical protein
MANEDYTQSPAEKALMAIIAERRFQDDKYGTVDKVGHSIGEWILLIEDELAEAKRALIKGGTGRDSVLMEIVQIAALGMACIEQHGTKERGRSV